MNPETAKIAQKDFERAQQELDSNNVLAALACLERALGIWNDPLWHSRLGFCVAKQRGQLTQAFGLCRTAIEHDPDNPLHYFYLGKVHLIAGNKDEALQAFRQGMALGGSPQLEQILAEIGTRKPPVISFLSRDNLLNKFLGIIFTRLGLRQEP
ncbi:MAG: tetratricopeptide repeat protein [Desulfuromonadaceae bacterium]|nr:tetratricopeptide repeat protein [Desulfuromonadaceae bacterium]